MATILNPQIDPCHVLPVLVEVLNPSNQSDTINKYLQRMGYDIVLEPVIKAPTVEQEESQEPFKENGWLATKDQEYASGYYGQEPKPELSALGSTSGAGSIPERKRIKNKRQMPGLNGEQANEIDKKRKAWLWERLQQERTETAKRRFSI